MKQHNGFIDVNSNVGTGTTFTVYLPLVAEAAPIQEQPEAEIPRGQGETVLVVEDEAGVLHVLKVMLEQLGYRVLTASDGLEALEVCDAHADEVALVLTDVVMPRMGGVELLESLKGKHPQMRVLTMTGYPAEKEGAMQLAEGIAGHLDKPLSLEQVAQALNRALRKRGRA